jgi:hypothetical protein
MLALTDVLEDVAESPDFAASEPELVNTLANHIASTLFAMTVMMQQHGISDETVVAAYEKFATERAAEAARYGDGESVDSIVNG